MDLDEQLEIMEETGETEAEWTDQETELQDVEDDIDEYLGEDAMESDLEHAYDSFITTNEVDYDGYDPSEVERSADEYEAADVLHSEGYHLEDAEDLEEEVIEMEIEDGDIEAYIVDEDGNEIGFILLDENGEEQEYYFVADDDEEDEDGEDGVTVIRASDEEEIGLGLTRDDVTSATADMNSIYREGASVVGELKGAYDDIMGSFDFLKK